MVHFIKILEKVLISSILVVFSILLILSFIDIVYEIYLEVKKPPLFVVSSGSLMELFSLFLIIIIGVELLETIKAYLQDQVIHVELVVLVAIIAIARKVIVWDFNKYSFYELIALSVMMLALGVTYFLVRRTGIKEKEGEKKT